MPTLAEFVKAYDVRGIVPDQLSPRVARRSVPPSPRSSRSPTAVPASSSATTCVPALPSSSAFAAGVTSRGVDVVLIGLCSTDGLYYASGALGLPGAMFTASHNPARYNGIKLCRLGARPVGQDSGLAEIRDLAQWMLDGGTGLAAPVDGPGSVESRDLLADYAAFLRGLVDLSGIRPLKVVVDAGNGMGGHTVPAVLGTGAGLAEPLEIVPLYFELDGTFPNHEANPLDPANLVDLQAAVRQHGADIGLAFDGDADRCFVVDADGEPVSPSAITGLVATREIDAGPRRWRQGGRRRAQRHLERGRGRDRARGRRHARAHAASATPSSRPRWPATEPSSAESTRRTTTSATSGSPTPACSRPCTCSRRSASRSAPLAGLRPVRALRRVGRDQLDRDRPAGRHRADRGVGQRAGARTDETRRPHHRVSRGHRPDVVVQRARLQHRAAAAAQRRGCRP